MNDWYWIAVLLLSIICDWQYCKRPTRRRYDEGYAHGLIDGELRAQLDAIVARARAQ